MKASAFLNFYYRFRQSGTFWKSATSIPGTSATRPVDVNQKIVVVGIGLAALTALEELHRLGFKNVQVVAEDKRFGGKCVHFGCMPSEAFWLNSKTAAAKIAELAQLTEEKFKSWGFDLHDDSAAEISGNSLLLKSGKQLTFDALLLATGNEIKKPEHFPPTTAPDQFWNLKSGHLVIVSEGEPTAWSYADMAFEMGLTCTIIQTEKTLLDHLPSFQNFTRQIRKRGVRFFGDAKLSSDLGSKKISARSEGKFHEVPYDELIYVGPTRLRLPKVDGKIPDVFAINLQASQLKNRSNVFVLGDAGGFLSATEAELKALQLVWSMTNQAAPISLGALSALPLRLHAKQSWASTGDLTSALKTNWHEVDFKQLGWSLLHDEDGKLWYTFNQSTGKVDSIHICHSQASELIAIASALLELPVNDSRWLTSAVHPSAAEIFKYTLLDIRRRFPRNFKLGRDSVISAQLRLPTLNQLRDGSDLFNEREIQTATLEKDPWLYLALAYVARQEGNSIWPLYDEKAQRYSFKEHPNVHYTAGGNGLRVQWENHIYEINN